MCICFLQKGIGCISFPHISKPVSICSTKGYHLSAKSSPLQSHEKHKVRHNSAILVYLSFYCVCSEIALDFVVIVLSRVVVVVCQVKICWLETKRKFHSAKGAWLSPQGQPRPRQQTKKRKVIFLKVSALELKAIQVSFSYIILIQLLLYKQCGMVHIRICLKRFQYKVGRYGLILATRQGGNPGVRFYADLQMLGLALQGFVFLS